jgi:hypothetical protein
VHGGDAQLANQIEKEGEEGLGNFQAATRSTSEAYGDDQINEFVEPTSAMAELGLRCYCEADSKRWIMIRVEVEAVEHPAIYERLKREEQAKEKNRGGIGLHRCVRVYGFCTTISTLI